jgi:hypothetical protein
VTLLTALLVRNEAAPDRYLRAVLTNARQWSRQLLVLDDHSTDDTPTVCREYGAHVLTRRDPTPAWGAEAPARRELWDIAAEAAAMLRCWVLFQDADMILSRDPTPLTWTESLNTWCWPLYDQWSETHYRADPPFWQGHLHPRAWLVCPWRVPDGWTPDFGDRGLHAGHLPANWPSTGAVAPPDYYWLHRSYRDPTHRRQKARQYLDRRDTLTDFEIAHAASILDGDAPRPGVGADSSPDRGVHDTGGGDSASGENGVELDGAAGGDCGGGGSNLSR